MTGVSKIRRTDRIVNAFSWNAILLRDGTWWSINHYPAGRAVDGTYKPEWVEFRYDVRTAKEFDQLKIDCAKEGIKVAELASYS